MADRDRRETETIGCVRCPLRPHRQSASFPSISQGMRQYTWTSCSLAPSQTRPSLQASTGDEVQIVLPPAAGVALQEGHPASHLQQQPVSVGTQVLVGTEWVPLVLQLSQDHSSLRLTWLRSKAGTGALKDMVVSVSPREAIVPWPCVFQDSSSGHLHLLLMTTSATFSRLSLPLPHSTTTPDAESAWQYSLTQYSLQSMAAATIMHAVDLDTLVLSNASGKLIQLDCPRGVSVTGEDTHMDTDNGLGTNYREYELEETSVLNTISSLVPSLFKTGVFKTDLSSHDPQHSSSASQPISLASLCYAENLLLFTLSRDRKLRIWNLITHTCVKTLQLSQGQGALLLPPIPQQYIQVFDEDILESSKTANTPSAFNENVAQFKLAVYTAPVESADPLFNIFQGKVDSLGQVRDLSLIQQKCVPEELNMEGDMSSRNDQLVDFVILREDTTTSDGDSMHEAPEEWEIWTLWNRARIPILRHSSFALKAAAPASIIEGNVWWNVTSSIQKSTSLVLAPNASEGTSLSQHEQILEYIFEPGRFSFHVICKALKTFVAPSTPSPLNWTDLRAQVMTHLGSQINLQSSTSQDSSTPINKFELFEGFIQSEYNRFLSLCQQYQIQDSIPSSLAFMGQERWVVHRGHCSALRLKDETEILNQSLQNLEDWYFSASDNDLTCTLGFSKDTSRKEWRSDFKAFKELSQTINQYFSPQKRILLRNWESDRLLESLECSPRDYADILRERYLTDLETPEFLQLFKGFYSSMRHPLSLLRGLLSLINGLDNVLGSSPVAAETNGTDNQSCWVSDELLSNAARELVQSRHELALQVLVVLVISTYLGPSSLGGKVSISLLAESITTFHSISVLKRLSETRLDKGSLIKKSGSNLEASQDILSGLSSLSVVDGKILECSRTLFHQLIQHLYIPNGDLNYLTCFKFLTITSNKFIQSLGFLSHEKCITLTPEVLKFVNKLMAYGYEKQAMDILGMYPLTAGGCYLMGRLWMERKEYERAEVHFNQGSTGLDTDLKYVLPPSVLKDGLPGYILHVMTLSLESQVPSQVLNFAKQALEICDLTGEEGSKLEEKLKRTIVSQALEIDDFDEAYTAMIRLQSQAEKNTCLRQFVTSLCQAGDLDGLVRRFPFVEMKQEVEETLLFKARTESVTNVIKEDSSKRVNYYKVLYSLYIYWNDFRNASQVMYQYIQRLATLSPDSIHHAENRFIMSILTEQAQSYLAAMNALKFVHPDSAWFTANLDMSELIMDPAFESRKVNPGLSQLLASIEEVGTTTPKKAQIYVDVIDAVKLHKDYVLTLSKLELASQFPDFGLQLRLPDPSTAMSLYFEAGKTNGAIAVGETFGLDCSTVFSQLAEYCFYAVQGRTRDLESLEDIPSTWEGDVAQKGWTFLENLLKRHDSKEKGFRYYKAVADRILSIDAKAKLPLWLNRFYLTQFPEDLLRLFLKYDALGHAKSFSAQLISQSALSFPGGLVPKNGGRWMPYSLIDQVIRVLRSEGNDVASLNKALQFYFTRVMDESEACRKF